MYLWLIREPTQQETTLGSLYLNGVRFCETLEDAIREVAGQPVESWKVAGQTAIPAGLYRLTCSYSPKFGRPTPEIVDVPGFTGIRIHGGNRAADTEGCLIVGRFRAGLIALGDSTPIRVHLDSLVTAAYDRQEPMWIRVENPRTQEPIDLH